MSVDKDPYVGTAVMWFFLGGIFVIAFGSLLGWFK